jgi:DNA-binding response OmpR family regulator
MFYVDTRTVVHVSRLRKGNVGSGRAGQIHLRTVRGAGYALG